VKQKLLKGMKAGDKTFKTHLDGYDFTPFFKGKADKGSCRKLTTSGTLALVHAVAGAFIASFKEYPPSQRVGSMNLDQVMEQLQSGITGRPERPVLAPRWTVAYAEYLDARACTPECSTGG
jgi:hypothetical protein